MDDGGNGIGSDGFEWSDLRLEGPGGTVPLTKAQQYTVGYGEARYDAKARYGRRTPSLPWSLISPRVTGILKEREPPGGPPPWA